MVKTQIRSVEDRVQGALEEVMDPEIPAVSIVDLGMVERIHVSADAVEVDLLPTFVGCPAKDVIGEDVVRAVRTVAEGRDVRAKFVLRPAWTTERISQRGKEGLREYGISPQWEGGPPKAVPVPLMRRSGVACPYCGGRETVMESAWGTTPCRTAHYCSSCRNPFEGFKEK